MSDSAKQRNRPNGVDILWRQYIEGDPAKERFVQEEMSKLVIAQQIFEMRTQANLTQAEVAALVGTSPTVMSRLESGEYDRYSLSTLRRIAEVFNKVVEVRFVEVRVRRKMSKSDARKNLSAGKEPGKQA